LRPAFPKPIAFSACSNPQWRTCASTRYPDVATQRGDGFVLIEILWSVGRSVKVKRKLTADLVAALAREPGLDPEQVMIVFVETAWENWAFAGGRLLHA
jgi:phenylpyruvate tautomerase PptA (4-oxalocrotonate tautomerase family)